MIRDAQINDWPKLLELGLRLKEKTPYRDVELDREQTLHTYGQCMNSALGFAKLSENADGEITGLLLGVVDPLWWSRSRYATDLVFYCEDGRSGLPLLRSFIDWAWSVPKVIEVTCGQSSGINTVQAAKLYYRCGFEKVGGLYTLHKPEV